MKNVLIGFCVMLLSAASLAEVQSHSVTSIRRPLSRAAKRSIVSGTTMTNGVTWSYSVVDGAVHLVLRRSSAVPPDTAGALVIPDLLDGKPVRGIRREVFINCTNITSVTIPSSVTSIGDMAFSGCSSLTSVSIPTSVRSIGEGVFSGCRSLTSVSVPASVTRIGYRTFSGCSSLTSVSIPASVTSLGGYAFAGCSSLTSVSIPASVTCIGGLAFVGCNSLKEIVVSERNTAYSSFDGVLFDAEKSMLIRCPATKSGEYVIPSSVTLIGNSAFSGCSLLKSVAIPKSVTRIDECAFSGCSGLTSVSIPSSVTSLGRWAFSGCRALTSVSIPSNRIVRSDRDMFWNCPNLKSVNVMKDGKVEVMTLDDLDAYEWLSKREWLPDRKRGNCQTIKGVTTTNGVTWAYRVIDGTVVLGRVSIGNRIPISNDRELKQAVSRGTSGELNIPDVLDGKPVRGIGWAAFSNCTNLKSVTIPSGVTNIGQRAFANCTNLTSVTIPSGVTNIGVGAFRNCSSLGSVSIPTSVRSIGESAFHDCSSLTSVSIPPSVTSIEWNTFYGCNSLTSVLIPTSVTDIDDVEFCRCSSLTEFVVADGNAAYSSLDGVLFDAERRKLIRCPIAKSGEYVIPPGVTSIGERAFQSCTNLTFVTIPQSVTNIGELAFYGCSSLASLTIPPDVANIGERAFFRCSELISVTIPSMVTNVDGRAFDDCTNLKLVYIVRDGKVERMPIADFLRQCARASSSRGLRGSSGQSYSVGIRRSRLLRGGARSTGVGTGVAEESKETA